MKKTFFYFLLTSIFIMVISCDDPIFYTVSIQNPPLDPLIKGSPTKFVMFGDNMYVASGYNIWYFNGTIWDSISFSSRVLDIAATGSYLYAAFADSENNKLWISSDGINGTEKPVDINIQAIFAAGNYLYISARSTDSSTYSHSYSVHYLQGENDPVSISVIDADDAQRVTINNLAVSGTTVYFCSHGSGSSSTDMKGKGIFSSAAGSSTATLITGSSSISFTGIITLNSGEVVAIARDDGQLYRVTATEVTILDNVKLGRPSNNMGTLALWTDENNAGNNLLLAGTQDITNTTSTSHTHGYMELILGSAGEIAAAGEFDWPGIRNNSTMENRESFITSLGKHGVNHLFQYVYPASSSNSGMKVLFASTQQNGVWSYRDRGSNNENNWQWNAEQQP